MVLSNCYGLKCSVNSIGIGIPIEFSVKFPAVRAATGTYSRTRVEHAPTTAVCFKCSVNSIGIGREKCVSIELLWFKMQCEFKNTRVS